MTLTPQAQGGGAMTPRCPSCSGELGGVEYRLTSQDYDGVSEWRCLNPACGKRWGRWSWMELADGTIEGRYGHGSPVAVREEPAR